MKPETLAQKRTPYSQRTDLEKIKSNWKKTCGLYRRGEWSTTVMRSVTTVELTANFIIRKELTEKRNIDEGFVDHLLIWANGIRGKFDKLIIPVCQNDAYLPKLKNLNKKIQVINQERNRIAHSGHFSSRASAGTVMKDSKEIIEVLIGIYDPNFLLPQFQP